MPKSQTDIPIDDAVYLRRMRFIQGWRRVVLMVVLLLCMDAVVTVWLDPGLAHPNHLALIQSLFAFMVALVIAVNFLTFRLRK